MQLLRYNESRFVDESETGQAFSNREDFEFAQQAADNGVVLVRDNGFPLPVGSSSSATGTGNGNEREAGDCALYGFETQPAPRCFRAGNEGTTEVNSCDGPGNLVSIIDQGGNQVQYTCDAAHQLVTVVQATSQHFGQHHHSFVTGNTLVGVRCLRE